MSYESYPSPGSHRSSYVFSNLSKTKIPLKAHLYKYNRVYTVSGFCLLFFYFWLNFIDFLIFNKTEI